MSSSVHLRTRNKKYAFLVMAMLSFAKKFPEKPLTIPLKTLKLLYGTGVGNQPLKALRDLNWTTADGRALPVFDALLPNADVKPSVIGATFRPEFLAASSDITPDECRQGLFSGVDDVARVAFEAAVKEMSGGLRDWTIPNLTKAYRSRVLATQTPVGSTVARYVRICPLCGHGMVRLFFGTVEDYRRLRSAKAGKPEAIVLGDPSEENPRPRWVCTGCGLKLWQQSSAEKTAAN